MIRYSAILRTGMLLCFSLAVATCGWAANTYDPSTSFEQGFLSKSNPNGVWSYGHSASFTGPVSLYTQTSQPGVLGGTNTQTWSSGASAVVYNNGPAQTIAYNGGDYDLLANQIVLVPVGGEDSDVVFTAPAAGTYSVTGSFRGDQTAPYQVVAAVAANGSLVWSSGVSSDGQVVPFSNTVTLSAGSTVVFSVQQVPGSYQTTGLTVAITGPLVAQIPYYFSHLAVGEGWQTTLTLVNYSPQPVTCVTDFYSDIGSPLSISFSQESGSTRTDTLQAGQSIHDQTTGSPSALVQGWAEAICTGQIQASVLYRLYQSGVPVSEAGVNAETAATTEFATFAQTATGVAYANPSTSQSANVTLTIYDASGNRLASETFALGPMAHGTAVNIGPLLGIPNFTGFVKITSTLPIISLSLNAEAYPVISSLPPGDLPSSTPLVTP